MSFSRQPNPVWLFTDLEGNILDDNYYMFFLKNTIPYLPQPVYQDDQGVTPWANPLQFHPDGTLPDNMYFQDGLVYRLEIRRGSTQSDPLIRLIENFVAEDNGNPSDTSLPIDNQITNPQFAFIDFAPPYAINNTGNHSYEIAPGWTLELESVGAVVVTLSRVAIVGDENLPVGQPTNPSYALSIDITSGTLTSMHLTQSFSHAPAIWASEGLSVNFTGKMQNNSASISVDYTPSNGTATTVISDTLSSVYQLISGSVQLPASDSTDDGNDGFVSIVFRLPISGTIFLTNIQAVGSPIGALFPYAQTTVERQRDHTFHNYFDSLLRQSKGNLLTGWNFGLNPWQFITTANTLVAAQTQYIADQTILHQETAGAFTSKKGGGETDFGLQLTSVNGVPANRFALIQYIDTGTCLPFFSESLSSLVKSVLYSSHATATKMKVRLIYRNDAPPTISNIEPITGWDANGDLTFSAGWTAVDPINDPAYAMSVLLAGNSINTVPPLSFDSFILPNAPTSTAFLGIVVYTTASINNSLGTEDSIAFSRISLVPNDFAIDAPPETFDESLRKCQYYYEKSYNYNILPGTVTPNGSLEFPAEVQRVGTTQARVYENTFNLRYKQTKCMAPTITFYSPVGTINRIEMQCYFGSTSLAGSPVQLPSSQWAIVGTGFDSSIVRPIVTGIVFSSATSLDGYEATMEMHYTADSRLGI